MDEDKKTKEELAKNKCCEACKCEDCGEEGCKCENCECCDGKCCEICSCGVDDKQSSNDGVKQADLSQVQELEERVKRLEDQLKRAVADYQNLEKRVAEGRSELSSWATASLLQKILPILDHLEKAVGGMSDEDRKSGWAKGVELAITEFKGVLKSEGLEEIEGSGEFDPRLHEAVDMREPSSAEASAGKGDNKVLEITEKGYKINNKVLRVAKVVVGKSSSAKASEDKEGEK